MPIAATEPERIVEVFERVGADYAKIRAAYAAAGYDARYPLGGYWIDNLRELIPLIASEANALTKLHRVHETVMYGIASPVPETRARMIDWYLQDLRARGIHLQALEPSLEESAYANPDNTMVRDGRRLSADFLRTLVFCLEIEAHCAVPAAPFRVLELGAGYGGLARTFKLRHPGATYVIIDIPETLFFSSMFLRLSFPDARTLTVTEAPDLSGALDDYDFVFVPTMFAEVLRGCTFTLFCNTASLGEMKNVVVRHWMDFVQRQVCVRYFFGLNRFLNTLAPIPDNPRFDENAASVSFDAGWGILHWEVDPPFARCPYLETLVSRNLEIVAERLGEDQRDRAAEERRSRELMASVAGQDWFTRPLVRGYRIDVGNGAGWPPHGSRASGQLTPDLTMTGPLFALWESIRLHPEPANVRMMLAYLETLTGRWAFEEMYYYEDLLAELTGEPVVSTRPRPPARSRRVPADLVRRLTPGPVRRALKRLLRRLYYGEPLS